MITDATLSKTNLLPLIESHLAKAGLKMDVFDGVEPEPSIQTVKAGAELVRESGPDWIIGMGGGSMGHALGATFHIPHGRAVALFLPYAIEFAAMSTPERFDELATTLGFSNGGTGKAAFSMAQKVRNLSQKIGSPTSIGEAGVRREDYELQMDKLMDDAFNDTQMVTAPRAPTYDDLRQIFLYAYDGRSIDF